MEFHGTHTGYRDNTDFAECLVKLYRRNLQVQRQQIRHAQFIFFFRKVKQAGVITRVRLLEQSAQAGINFAPSSAIALCFFSSRYHAAVFAGIRKKTIRSMVACTAKFNSRTLNFSFLKAMFFASNSRQRSISSKKASSTSAVPFLPLIPYRVLIERPRWIASLEKIAAISSATSQRNRDNCITQRVQPKLYRSYPA